MERPVGCEYDIGDNYRDGQVSVFGRGVDESGAP